MAGFLQKDQINSISSPKLSLVIVGLEILMVWSFCLKPTAVADSGRTCFLFIDRQQGVFSIVINFWVNKKKFQGFARKYKINGEKILVVGIYGTGI